MMINMPYFSLRVINIIREEKIIDFFELESSFIKLINKLEYGHHLSNHYLYFEQIIFDLYKENLVSLVQKNGTKIEKKFDMKHLIHFMSEIVDFHKLFGDVYIKLSPRYYELQNLIGFSICASLKANESIWGDPNRSLKTDIFVIMPFSNEFKPIYDDHIEKVEILSAVLREPIIYFQQVI